MNDSELQNLFKMIGSFNDILKNLHETQTEVKEMKSEIQLLRKENVELKKRTLFLDLHDSQTKDKEMKSEIQLLRKENDKLKKRTDSLSKSFHESDTKVKDLNKKLNDHMKIALIRKNESYYQKLLESQTNSGHMYIPNCGITDITTEKAHIEIKRWSIYTQALGQLWKYNMARPRENTHVYLFGTRPKDYKIAEIIRYFKSQNIQMFSFDEDDRIICHFDENVMEKKLDKPEKEDFGMIHFLREYLQPDANNLIHIHNIKDAYYNWYNKRTGNALSRLSTTEMSKWLKAEGFSVPTKTFKIKSCCTGPLSCLEGWSWKKRDVL